MVGNLSGMAGPNHTGSLRARPDLPGRTAGEVALSLELGDRLITSDARGCLEGHRLIWQASGSIGDVRILAGTAG